MELVNEGGVGFALGQAALVGEVGEVRCSGFYSLLPAKPNDRWFHQDLAVVSTQGI